MRPQLLDELEEGDDQLEEGEDNHRRPYILCRHLDRHPTNGQWYVLDVTVAWCGGGRRGVDDCKPGAASVHAEQHKDRSYADARERDADQIQRELCEHQFGTHPVHAVR
eukprot:SAG22_NODE_1544_length_4159_cov_2.435468_1_plen_109_part_00